MTAPLVLASTSPQRSAILEQLRIPFTTIAPAYVEHDPPDADPVELVREHAEGKARSVHVAGSVTLGVDTTVHLGGRVYAKPTRAQFRCATGRYFGYTPIIAIRPKRSSTRRLLRYKRIAAAWRSSD